MIDEEMRYSLPTLFLSEFGPSLWDRWHSMIGLDMLRVTNRLALFPIYTADGDERQVANSAMI